MEKKSLKAFKGAERGSLKKRDRVILQSFFHVLKIEM